MATLKIDELNINKPYKERSEPYEQYFGIMDISKRQKRERVLLAQELEDIFFEFLVFCMVLHQHGKSYDDAQEQLESRYRDKMYEILPDDGDFILWYAAAYAANATEVTAKHLNKLPKSFDVSDVEKIAEEVKANVSVSATNTPLPKTEIQPEMEPTDSWYVSLDRAKFNAENEANTVLNRSDYLKAKEAGYKRKRWLTEHDDRVRPTHQEVEGVTIPIDQLYLVGDSLMAYPHDASHGASPSELVNCRCAAEYLK